MNDSIYFSICKELIHKKYMAFCLISSGAPNLTNSFNTSKDFTEEIVSLFDNQTTHINTKTFTIKHHNTVRKFAHFAIFIVLGILVQNAISLSSIKRKFTASLPMTTTTSVHPLADTP